MGSRKWLGLVATLALVPVCYGVMLTPAAEYQKGEFYWYSHILHRRQLAVYWWRKASYQGYAPAQFRLSSYYIFGLRYPGRDQRKRSSYWAHKAALQGYAPAEYVHALFDKQDYWLAFYWAHKAAIQGYGPAEKMVADDYNPGHGVQTDVGKQIYWLKKAADQGSPGAAYRLGSLYYRGPGIAPNYVRAYKWFSVVEKHGDLEPSRDSKLSPYYIPKVLTLDSKFSLGERHKLRTLMTTAQLARARALTAAWERKHPQAMIPHLWEKQDKTMATAWAKSHGQ